MRKPKAPARPELKPWKVAIEVFDEHDRRGLRIEVELKARSALDAAETILVASRGHWPPWWKVSGRG